MDETLAVEEGIEDASVARSVAIGVPIGVVLFFGLTLVVCLLAGQTFAEAVVVALWPALVGGPFIGAVFGMSSVVLKLEAKERAGAEQAPAASSPPRVTPGVAKVA